MSIMQLNLSTEKKIIGGISLLSIVILIGGVFIFSGQQAQESSIPEDQIVARGSLHWHPNLEIYIKGEKQEIPVGIGLSGNVHQEMHTHDEDAKDGVIHMEMQGLVTKDETRLGNFFKTWGKEFSSTKIFNKINGEEGKVTMKVNGTGRVEFENYEMRDGDKIEIRYE